MSKSKPYAEVIAKRNEVTKRELKRIRRLYNEWAREVKAQSQALKKAGDMSKARDLAHLYYEMRNASRELSRQIEVGVRASVDELGDTLVETNKRWLKSLGLETDKMLYRMDRGKKNAINKVLSGRLYKNGRNLSDRIWNLAEGHDQDIYNIIGKGIAQNKSVYEISKDIEKYVNPNKRLPWSKDFIDPKTGRLTQWPVHNKKIDYNAQRLVRTTIQHSYQEAMFELNQDNPFVTGYLWEAVGNHPCPVCLDRDGTIYPKGSCPYDHPNGMCEIEPVVDYDKAEKDIAKFYENPVYYPKIKKFTDPYG